MFSYSKKKTTPLPKAITGETTFYGRGPGIQYERFNTGLKKLAQRNPNLWVGFAVVGAGVITLGIKELVDKNGVESEIAFRKTQLEKPTYELKGDEVHNFPWNKSNIDDWMFRKVTITGRPRHSQAMLVPRIVDNYEGYDYIVPLITKENEDGSEEHGILLNKGWIPHEYQHPGARFRIENVFPQTFEAFVSKNSELDYKNNFFKDGNSTIKARNKWGHLYLPDMADATGFKNADKMKTALLEVVDTKATKLDERSPKHYSKNLTVEEDYPYPKTYAGALQTKKMPWDCTSRQLEFFSWGTASTVFALALRLAK